MRWLLLLLIPASLFARREDIPIWDPWLTSPFFAPTAAKTDPGSLSLQPSIAILWQYGTYNEHWEIERQETIWLINPYLDLQTGITEKIGIEALFGYNLNFQSGKSANSLDDTFLFLGYQLLEDNMDSWEPNLRIQLQITFPTGKYRNFDPDKVDIESTGEGAYQLGPVIAYQKIFPFTKSYFSLYWAVGYIFPFKTTVKGFNTYGGGYGTRGTIRPGDYFYAFLSGEYAFSQHWVFAWDSFVFYNTATSSFSGTPGTQPNGETAKTGLDSSINFNLSPQIEYNFSETSGLLFGVWATIAGRNSNAFLGFVFTYVQAF